MGAYSIQEETLTEWAEGSKKQLGTYDNMYLNEMTEQLNDIEANSIDPSHENKDLNPQTHWIRPNDWPDLDSLNLLFEGDESFIYVTYDANELDNVISWAASTINNTKWNVDIGHIENGLYIVDEENHDLAGGTNVHYTRWINDLSGYIVVRITGYFSRIGLYPGYNGPSNITINSEQQVLLERIAYLPTATTIKQSSGGSPPWANVYIQKDTIANNVENSLTDISGIEYGSYNLIEVDISHLYTQNVVYFNNAFRENRLLKYISLNNTSFNNAESLSYMFYGCQSIDIPIYMNITAPSLTNIDYMFSGCDSIPKIELHLNNQNGLLTSLDSLFKNCSSLKEVDIACNCTNVSKFNNMFENCVSLKEVDISRLNTNQYCEMKYMFNHCFSLNTIKMFTNNVYPASLDHCFYDCRSLKRIDLNKIKVTTHTINISSIFYNCVNLIELNFPNDWDTSSVTGTTSMVTLFSEDRNLKKITGIKNWVFPACSLSKFFYNCVNLKEVDISNWDVSKVTALDSMFYGCSSIKELDVKNWNISNVTNLNASFADCSSLKILDVSNWNTANVTTCSGTFNGCRSLREVNLSNWDVSKVTTFYYCFNSCEALESIGDISSWNAESCTTMQNMFYGCSNLKNFPNISNVNLSKLTTMKGMFGSSGLIKIDLHNLDLPKLTTVDGMLSSCHKIEKINCKDWTIPLLTVTNGFVDNCYVLKDIRIPPFTVNFKLNTFIMSLTKKAILTVFNDLPVISSAKTIQIGTSNLNKLLATDKAIATQKGWTVAA